MTSAVPIPAPELARAVAAQRDRLDLDVLARAYQVSAQAHRGQKRQSGDDFVSHSVAVATILADQQMDTTTIAAALLHDVVEDSNVSVDDIRRDFGNEIADLVDGLTKLSTLQFRSTAEEQAENYRKLLVSVAKDARVIIIKLADRLHNMRTLEFRRSTSSGASRRRHGTSTRRSRTASAWRRCAGSWRTSRSSTSRATSTRPSRRRWRRSAASAKR